MVQCGFTPSSAMLLRGGGGGVLLTLPEIRVFVGRAKNLRQGYAEIARGFGVPIKLYKSRV